MKNLLLISIVMVSLSAKAEIGGAVFVNSNNTEAKLVVNETMIDGDLSKLFDQMKVAETGSATKKTKTFALKNGRFGFICNKGLFTSTPPSTSCTFFIKHGENTSDINTFISTLGDQKVAILGISQIISRELNGIFPTDTNNSFSYILSLANKVGFEVQGSTLGTMTIGFSAR